MANMVVSRFCEETIMRNREFREKTGVGCIYGTPVTMNQFGPNEVVFVIEMNLKENKVEGIGLVLNIVKTGPQYNMYDNYNYNRYVYCGKYRLDREDLLQITLPATEHTEEKLILDVLDHALFKGKSHMKRGIYFSRITNKLLFRWGSSCNNMQETIMKTFVDKFGITIVMEQEINYELYGL